MHVEGLGSVILRDPTQDFEGFPLHLLLFAADVRHDVVENVHAGEAGVSSTRDSLHRRYHAGFDRAKRLLQGSKGDNERSGAAVRICDDEPLLKRRRVESLLLRDNGQMRGVDERHDEGYIGIAPEVLRIGEHTELGRAEGGL